MTDTTTTIPEILYEGLCGAGREPTDRMVEAWVGLLARRVRLDEVQVPALIAGVDEALGDLEARRQLGDYPGPLTLEHVVIAYRKHAVVVRAVACGQGGCDDGLLSVRDSDRGSWTSHPCGCPRGREQAARLDRLFRGAR